MNFKSQYFYNFLLVLLTSGGFSAAIGQEEIKFTLEQVEKGEQIYKATCQVCHGNRLSNGQFGTPLKGRYFQRNWAGRSLGELVKHTFEEMPPDNVESMSVAEYGHVVSFILQANGISASETEMGDNLGALNEIPLPW